VPGSKASQKTAVKRAAISAATEPAEVTRNRGLSVGDGAQAVLASAARAIGDVLVPLGLFGVSFWLLGVPLAFWLGLRADYGVPGLLVGMALGLALAALALGIRFWATVRRGVRPI
jgi:MATE family multidrug resistance protein